MGENITLNKSIIWKFGVGLFGALFIVSFLTGGFGFIESMTGNSVAAVSDDDLTKVSTVIKNYQYDPDVITVKKGTRVELTIQNKDNVIHGLHLPQFGIQDSQLPLGTKVVQFIAIDTPTNGQAVPTCIQEHGETLTFNVI